jgi:hypothetical protein
MRFNAISCGYAVPYIDFDATIHSIFRTAVNLKPTNKDLLLTLVAASEADLPQGIRLASPEDYSFEQLNADKYVICRDNRLIFANSNVEVDFYHGRRWQCDLPALGTDLTNPAVADAWECVWQSLNEYQARLGAEIIAQALLDSNRIVQSTISRQMEQAIRALIMATRSYQLDDPSALSQLIGLGTGLTPSGDDFLVGYLAGLWCTVRNFVARRRFVSKLGQLVFALSEKTNDISRTYLYYAASGQVSSRLDSLAREISRAQSTRLLLHVAESAMQSGHTSGTDAVTGLLFGLATWEGEAI